MQKPRRKLWSLSLLALLISAPYAMADKAPQSQKRVTEPRVYPLATQMENGKFYVLRNLNYNRYLDGRMRDLPPPSNNGFVKSEHVGLADEVRGGWGARYIWQAVEHPNHPGSFLLKSQFNGDCVGVDALTNAGETLRFTTCHQQGGQVVQNAQNFYPTYNAGNDSFELNNSRGFLAGYHNGLHSSYRIRFDNNNDNNKSSWQLIERKIESPPRVGNIYEIVNMNSQKSLDSHAGSQLYQWDPNGSPRQRWKLNAYNSTWFEIQNVETGKCLRSDAIANRYISYAQCGTALRTTWKVNRYTDNLLQFIDQHGNALDVPDRSTSNTRLITYAPHGGYNQLFHAILSN